MNGLSTITTQSISFKKVIDLAKNVAKTDVTVLLTGETGTGKEVIAHAIQNDSNRSEQAFLKLNCAALPHDLIESELFGHQQGAFTGAVKNQKGLLISAHNGTLFLDEVDSLPKSIQGKLLHFLDSGEFIPLGTSQSIHVDIRIVAATNADLVDLVKKGLFRADLYFRLNVFPIHLPRLIDRDEDIEILIQQFFDQFEQTYRIKPPTFSKKSLRILKNYKWLGNIRELKNICEKFSILHSGKVIESHDLPEYFKTNCRESTETAWVLPENGLDLDEIQLRFIRQALDRTQGSLIQSAKLLGISRYTLRYRMKRYGIVK